MIAPASALPPEGADPNRVHAKFHHGVLQITLPASAAMELSILRRYIAACFLDSARLQHPPMPQGASNPYGEIAFVSATVRIVTDAIIAGRSDEQCGDDLAQARADWIIDNLYIG
jgi:hypothetical protein